MNLRKCVTYQAWYGTCMISLGLCFQYFVGCNLLFLSKLWIASCIKAFNPEPVLPPISGRPEQVEKVLKTRYHDAMTKLQPQGDLKRICETDLGLVSQCCLTKHVFRMSKQYLANVALKINVKVGGRNTVLVDAISRRIPLVSDRPTYFWC
ncbi:hypothetical protein MANES_02G220690v8 [Manihot esculenta]|uniref:Uncharacterized protein n=1 Tax=Manihot esculenta TaxID=3983 RepID=A0ACB7I837_MANES|nr:hypothetical protein MANES_02G220690v8 [Manihot esculenta]